MRKNEAIIALYFKSIEGFSAFESKPRDFGTGDALYRSEAHTLEVIGKNEGINLTTLAEKLCISKSGTSKFVNKLLAKGLIIKQKDVNNRKEVLFSLTTKGQTAFEGHEKFKASVFSPITALVNDLSDEEQDTMVSFLKQLVSEVEKIV